MCWHRIFLIVRFLINNLSFTRSCFQKLHHLRKCCIMSANVAISVKNDISYLISANVSSYWSMLRNVFNCYKVCILKVSLGLLVTPVLLFILCDLVFSIDNWYHYLYNPTDIIACTAKLISLLVQPNWYIIACTTQLVSLLAQTNLISLLVQPNWYIIACTTQMISLLVQPNWYIIACTTQLISLLVKLGIITCTTKLIYHYLYNPTDISLLVQPNWYHYL